MSNANDKDKETAELEAVETQEWLESLDYVLQRGGPERVRELLKKLELYAYKAGVRMPFSANTPYINTIPPEEQPPFPGSREIERRIKSRRLGPLPGNELGAGNNRLDWLTGGIGGRLARPPRFVQVINARRNPQPAGGVLKFGLG